MCHELYDHPNNLQIESEAFCASGLVVMGPLLWEEAGFKGGGGLKLSFSGF